MRIYACVLAGCLSACATSQPVPPDQAPMVMEYANATTDYLWMLQGTTSDPLRLLMVEAELGARGQSENGDRYLGSRTGSTVGSRRYARTTTSLGDKDCADFVSAASAQRFFLSAGGPTYDPHGLDRDGDGFACEWGSKVREISVARIAVPVRTAYSSSECHVGPRGGTYTITASGNKNYDGC